MGARGHSHAGRHGGWRVALGAGALAFAIALAAGPAGAQEAIDSLGAAVAVPSDAQLYLEADTVTYNGGTGVVTASGGIQIDYGGYKLVAREVTYNQKTKRLLAKGDVELLQPDGNRIYADAFDITDDFRDGFVQALRIETPDRTRFAAAGAVRQNGDVTTLEQAAYTACDACKEHPERAPLFQVKARKIVWDQREKEVRYYGARFEFFGAPIAYLPYFQSADPTVKRKSGVLVPRFKQSSALGFGLRVPYFIALSDSYDATVTGTYYSKQGFLGQLEFRQALDNGFYTLQAAGISQGEPTAFGITTPDYGETARGMVGTTGQFALSDRWTFGWDVLAQSDQNFSNTYDIENFDRTFHTSEIYLTGLGDRSYFDLRAQRFDVQTLNALDQDTQPDILPTLDYGTISEDRFGGEVEVNVNVVNLMRDDSDIRRDGLLCFSVFIVNGACDGSAGFPFRSDYFRRNGLEGDYTRGTADAEWRRTFTTDEGLLLTPSLGLRGDVYRADMSLEGYPFPVAGQPYPAVSQTLGGIALDEAGFRGMARAELEARYPVLIQTANASHVIEPIAQIIARPNEMAVGNLPNEDAQSLVFNTTNLFAEDKFSGYDRIEGGTRANLGLRYVGTYAGGYSVDALVGQSYHLLGQNPYDAADLALVGFDSGLETSRSDYVGSFSVATPVGVGFGVQGRFDEESLDVERTDFAGSFAYDRVSTSVVYSFIGAQPIYSFPVDRSQVAVGAGVQLTEFLRATGSVSYDIESGGIIDRSIGIGYADECYSMAIAYQSTSDRYQVSESQNSVLFRIGLRTIADADFSYGLN